MDLRFKLIKKVILIAVLLITLVCFIYYRMNEKNPAEEKQKPVVLSYDEIMNTPPIINGKALYKDSCSACHGFREVGWMMLDKIVDSVYDKKVLYAFIRNSDSVMKSRNLYYNSLYKKFGIIMKSFPNLTDSSLDNIMLYIKAEKIYQRMPKQ